MLTNKVTLLGDINVGKTSIVRRIVNNVFDSTISPTIGINFNYYFPEGRDKYMIELIDTSGQITYRSLLKVFYKRSNIVLLIFDVINKKSFFSLKIELMKLLYNSINDLDLFGIFIIGNKIDLSKEKIQYYIDEIEDFIKEMKNCYNINSDNGIVIKSLFVSAKTGENINYIKKNIETLCCKNNIKKSIKIDKVETTKLTKYCYLF